ARSRFALAAVRVRLRVVRLTIRPRGPVQARVAGARLDVEVALVDQTTHRLTLGGAGLALHPLLDRVRGQRRRARLDEPARPLHEERRPPLLRALLDAPLQVKRHGLRGVFEVEGDRADAPVVTVTLVPSGPVLPAIENDLGRRLRPAHRLTVKLGPDGDVDPG